MSPNPFLLAADGSPSLIPLLRESPGLASAQDEHGYSLMHAAASYNHLELLRALVLEFGVDVNLKDEDEETALFVVETQEAAKVLIEELGADFHHRGIDGQTAREKITFEGDYPLVSDYLANLEDKKAEKDIDTVAADTIADAIRPPPPGMKLTVGTIDATDDVTSEADPEFRRRIEELAQRDDFNDPSGQADLRRLVEDAIPEWQFGDERSVRSKQA
ncbi:hypothetical protein QQS21_002429 [Conoideocrella luteorostrata]|uniref:Ankyrin repeat-containing protein n=1 Tax=Conoideocrella luteorostrata TaxID=1105319 RepID=A0AAJ0CV88_9HYPO|nr:hypothetical protein QQS21_002429 [Conoideocrella luteorostrata]